MGSAATLCFDEPRSSTLNYLKSFISALQCIADATHTDARHPARAFPAAARHSNSPAGAAHVIRGVFCCWLVLFIIVYSQAYAHLYGFEAVSGTRCRSCACTDCAVWCSELALLFPVLTAHAVATAAGAIRCRPSLLLRQQHFTP
jgi:hypothetical protein